MKAGEAARRTVRAFPLTTLCLLSWGCVAAAAFLEASGDVPAALLVALLPAYLSGLPVHLAGGALWGFGGEPSWLAVAAVPLSLLTPLAGDAALRVLVRGRARRPHRRTPRRVAG